MNKAFFINGGAGRVLCSIPALEHHAKTNKDFVIVAESWGDLYLTSPILRERAFPMHHKNLFEDYLKDKEIISPEPYRLNAYFNQKANLIQAFDMLINGLDEVPETKELKLELPKDTQILGYNLVSEVKEKLKKDKVIVFQPFGSTVKTEGKFITDSSGRSFEMKNVYSIIEELKKDYGVILMSSVEIPGWEDLGVAKPSGTGLLEWCGIINAADYFLGCDSVGQHMAHGLNKPATVVIGSTYPENISYPGNKNFKIIDLGNEKRKYTPIRMTFDQCIDLNNESLMVIENDNQIKDLKKSIVNKIGASKKVSKPAFNNGSSNVKGAKMPPQTSFPSGGGAVDTLLSGSKKSTKKTTIDKVLELDKAKN